MLTAKEKLEEKQDNVQRLKQALDINKPLATVYYMKEDLRQIWNWTNDKKAAEWHLNSWIAMAQNSGINMLKKFAKTLEKHFEGILAYFDFETGQTIVDYRPAIQETLDENEFPSVLPHARVY